MNGPGKQTRFVSSYRLSCGSSSGLIIRLSPATFPSNARYPLIKQLGGLVEQWELASYRCFTQGNAFGDAQSLELVHIISHYDYIFLFFLCSINCLCYYDDISLLMSCFKVCSSNNYTTWSNLNWYNYILDQ